MFDRGNHHGQTTYSLAANLFGYYFTILSYIVTWIHSFSIKNIALNLRLLEAKLKTARHGTLSKYRLSEKNGMHVTPLTDKELKDNVSPISVSFVTLYACRCRLSIYYLVSVTIAGKLCRVCRWVEFSIFCQAWGLWKIKEPSKRVIQEVSVFML